MQELYRREQAKVLALQTRLARVTSSGSRGSSPTPNTPRRTASTSRNPTPGRRDGERERRPGPVSRGSSPIPSVLIPGSGRHPGNAEEYEVTLVSCVSVDPPYVYE